MASTLKSAPTITVFRGSKNLGAYVWSPFVTKLETRLRFAGLAYRTDAGSPKSAPRGKIPYMVISEPNSSALATSLADSGLIIEKLKGNGYLHDLNTGLSPVQKAHDMALIALLEDKLYFYQVYERWHENYYIMRAKVFGFMPYPLQVLVGLLAYRSMSAMLYGQGTSRFSVEEISAFRKQIWESLDALLVVSKRNLSVHDDSPFWLLGGTGPSEVDSVLYAFICSTLVCRAGPESRMIVKGFPALLDYAERIHNRYFPDYAHWE
ncbi:Failed axon connections-like protein [Lachnellula occidentalis]|uniref:Failed axon connections-like protein n=1 Tax=Lachnellula occidentalis TaxID=215460 RepID=A0A8H8UDK5_9HELO|nr:Failed axon connections-like protein [Lachnellula occidentalis]